MQIHHHNWRALAPHFAGLAPGAVTDEQCRTYAAGRFAAGLAPATVATELARVRTALAWAERRRLIERAPYVWVPSPGEPRARVLTEDEVLRLLDACRTPHIRLFAILAITTGGRHTALLELTWDRVDFASGTIDLRKPRAVEPMSQRHQKGRAIVTMNGLARAALSVAREGATSDHVVEWAGAPVKSAKKAFAAAARRAGLDGVTPHTLRHTAATLIWEAGVDPNKVARFLGHKDVRTTSRIYAKPAAAYVKDAADAVDLPAGRFAKPGERYLKRR